MTVVKGWYHGQPNWGNLLGTIKSLDMLGVQDLNCTNNADVIVHDVLSRQLVVDLTLLRNNCTANGEWFPVVGGHLSMIPRIGKALFQRVPSMLALPQLFYRALSTGAEWWDSPNKDDEDLYIFAHGHGYKRALGDFVQVSCSTCSILSMNLQDWR